MSRPDVAIFPKCRHSAKRALGGSAAARCGISLQGGAIVVRGSVGHMSAFMAQSGCLVVCGDAGEALSRARSAQLLVRDMGMHPELPGAVRVTVGTAAQNQRLLQAWG